MAATRPRCTDSPRWCARPSASSATRATVGIGLPGAVSPATGLVKNAYATPYNGRPLKADLERLLGRELRFENDANCFALSEATDGAARGGRIVFGAILGTGAGGGIVIDGRVVAGANGIAGEWGHNPLPWMDAGRVSRARTATAGARAASSASSPDPRLPPTTSARRASGWSLHHRERAAGGDARCARSLERHARRLARAFAHVINLLDPDVIVIGGGLSRIERLYADVPRAGGFVYSDGVVTRLVRAAHGDASGVRGAARLWDAPRR